MPFLNRWLLQVCAALLFSLTLQAGEGEPALSPDLVLLSNIKIRISRNQSQLPNYTCQQTTERSRRGMPDRKFELIDMVRLEVALVEGKELYGWPGANQMTESEISNLVSGTFGNGDFGLHARSIFLSDGAYFTRVADEIIDGHETIRYNYRVPLLSSGYRLKVPPNEAVVAYHGSFWVDAGTLDLARLVIVADDIPRSLGVQACSKTLEYQRTDIGGASFLLPWKAELLMVDLHGTENRNRTRFHGCRQYTGESVLTFADPPPDTDSPVKQETPEVALPDDFLAEIELTTPIDSASAAVGDPVEARLVRNLKDHGRLVAPKGATLPGRITRLEKRPKSFVFGFAFRSLEFTGSRSTLTGRDNELSILSAAHTPCMPSVYSACNPGGPSIDPLEIETNHLRLTRGFRMQLRSRLLKSEKQ